MCQLASFLYKHDEYGLELAVYDLVSHSNTQKHTGKTEKMGWYEGHYIPDNEIECRTPEGRDSEAEDKLRELYPNFIKFFNRYCPNEFNGNLDLVGCDLKVIKLPETVNGYLDLSGCDLKGIKLPETVNGYLDLCGCDLKGIKLPETVNGYLYLSGCDLKGIKLPETVNGSLYLSGCDLKGIKLPETVKGYLYLSRCDLTDIDIPERFEDKIIY
jgi:uncharacterized protein YjbI with pentapeptide repeats